MGENILVIHQGALGDVVLSFPALVALKKKKGMSLTLVACNQIGQVAQQLGVVDTHFQAERSRFCGLFSDNLSADMKAFIGQYHAIVNFSFSMEMEKRIRQHKERTHTITPRPLEGEATHVAAHITRQMQAKGLLDQAQGTEEAKPYLAKESAALESTGALSCPSMRENNTKTITQHTVVLSQNTGNIEKRKKSMFILHPGAGSPRKRWGLERFIHLADMLRKETTADIVFLIGPAEKDLIPFIEGMAKKSQIHVHVVEDLCKVITLFRDARCFIGNDSGLAHLAGYLGISTLAIFGPSATERWAPVGKAVKVLRGAFDCTPCFEIERENCHDPRCLEGITVEMVVAALGEWGMVPSR